ncbi:amino acid adenylation domain-containing protein [Flavobacterium sp. '19STA2R22 D10 B1']|uniref:amino acid adenylation domain-containing protein n=1 Tax=Flavobacterium aerium TaxID=3037261 RepID=UPI00278C176F|nr:amino acid adenylation domain-containing protein [Flavobacterium sp. '19STA2R22 D10 B1']
MQENTVKGIDSYELSVNQRNLWAIYESESSVFYNQVIVKLDNTTKEDKLKEAIHAVIQKNETLLFKAVKETSLLYPKQYIDQLKELEFQTVSKTELIMESIANHYLGYAYDIFKNMPIRFCYVTTESTKELIVRIYSFWADSYSTILFCEDLKNALINIETYQKNEREVVEYQNFSAWQNELFYEPEEEGVDFWKGYDYTLEKSIIPFISNSINTFLPKRTGIANFKEDQYSELKKEAKEKNTTIELVLFGKLIHYLTKFEQGRITVGYIPFKRSYDELSNTFGSVTKTLPVSIDISEYSKNYEGVIEKNLSAIDVWSDYFYINREKRKQPKKEYFNYNFEYIDISKYTENSICSVEDLYSVTDLFDFKISCIDNGKELSVNVYYNTNTIDELTAEILLAQLTSEYSTPLGEEIENSNTEIEIIKKANNTVEVFPFSNSVLEIVANKVKEVPNAIAIIYGEVTISYKELDEKSNQLANHLITENKIRKGDAVGILLDRSEWFIITMLAVLKSGAFYIPIDTEYPSERIQFILSDSNAKVLVTGTEIIQKLDFPIKEILIASDRNIYINDNTKISTTIDQHDIAYCIYTSGSTGTPKGCSVTHGNLLNYIQWANAYYFKEAEVQGNWGLITSVSFDLTVTALYTSITRGKQLHIGSNEKDIVELLKESFTNPDIDTIKLTPTHLTILQDLGIENTTIRTIICGGEQLQKRHLEIVHTINPKIKVFNEYGPTETTVGCIVKETSVNDETILIGKPIANTEIQLYDSEQNKVGIGVYGEIYISGAGVSKGYINRPEMTSEKFIKISDVLNYKTGDIGYWLPNGNIAYIGRVDDQVKIRGFRIELGEIEKELTKDKNILEAIVLVNEEEETKTLIAFIRVEGELNHDETKRLLRKNLPDYMIPSQFIKIIKTPLTTNGKIDKKELLEIRKQELLKNVVYIAPRTSIEIKVANIWKELFTKEQIGTKDDFFFLGGHSIKLIKLINQYQTEFNTKLEFKIFFENTTLESHALVLEKSDKEIISKIEKAPLAESYPISLMQKRLWLLSQNKDRSLAYNMGSEIALYDIDEKSFEKSIIAIIKRHESLRTIFKEDEKGETRQYIQPFENLGLEIVKRDFSNSSHADHDINAFISLEGEKVFDLKNGPLIRIGLLKKSPSISVFYYFMHHIIADAWSIDILSEEFEKYYQHYSIGIPLNLEELIIQYKDYTVWQFERFNSPEFKKHKEYWKNILSGDISKLQFSFANNRPKLKTYNGAEIFDVIAIKKIKAFYESTKGINVTPFMNFITILSVIFHQNSFEKDIIIGSPLAGRDHQDLQHQIGLFINTIPFRNKVDIKETYLSLLAKVKKTVLDGFAHKEYPFDLMVEDSKIIPDLSRNPLFDVMLVMTHDEELEKTTAAKKIFIENTNSKFDITFYINITEEEASYTISYNTDLFKFTDIERINSQFRLLIDLIAENSQRKIEDYSSLLKDDILKIEQESFADQLNQNLDEVF